MAAYRNVLSRARLPPAGLRGDVEAPPVRDPAEWYESTRSTIYGLRRLTTGPLPVRAAFALAAPFVPGVAGTVRLADSLVWEGTFEGRFEDRDYAMGVFARHNEAVRRRVPPERLLVFDVREGWTPLCDFFGVEAPERHFPRLFLVRRVARTTQPSSRFSPKP